MKKEYCNWYEKNKSRILEDYFSLLRFPSISTDPAHKKDMDACALWIATFLRKIGFEVEIWPTSQHPVIFASYRAQEINRPTLLIYNHYDVQPVDPLELWEHPPFEPTLKKGAVYARGASDNKGQLFYVLTALEAFLELSQEKNCNIKLFIEGGEECGSVGIKELLEEKKEALRADYCVIVDAGIPNMDSPAVTLGVRGITTMQVDVYNSSTDLHSGVFGGIVLSPLQALTTALARMWSHGKVAIPGFYEDVVEISARDCEDIDFFVDKEKLCKTFGIQAFGGESGFSLAESNCLRPTLEINGLCGGYIGRGFKTVIPAHAQVKISCRLVPNQQPDKIARLVAAFLKNQLPQGFRCEVEIHEGGMPVRNSCQTPIAKIAKKAYEEAFLKPCKFVYCPASVPIVAELEKISLASLILMGTSTDEDNIHAPNEHFLLEQFEKGFLTMAMFLKAL